MIFGSPDFPIFHQFSCRIPTHFGVQKSMILSLEWAQHIITGTCWFYSFVHVYVFMLEPITHDHSGGGDTDRKIRGI